ncbi:hypothetical protein MKX03_018100 [Papaver bracteatum]|nr:hypothetical protein MKX03_018100 [Papaver bracteatum]
MGFDPEKKEHKVFCFWRLSAVVDPSHRCYSDPSYASWEALIVGHDTKWRRISVVPDENNLIKIKEVLPPYRMGRNPVNANGIIYWSNKLMSCEEHFDDPLEDLTPTDPDVIIAFDAGSFHGVPRSADKILISLLIHNKMRFLYSYDRKTKTFEEIVMEGIFSIPPLHQHRSLFMTYTESLIPVLPQQDRGR